VKDRFLRSRAFEVLSRGGFVARGLVYGLIGALAVGAGGKATNQQGAFETVVHQPLGHVLLILIAVGLGGYALWRLVRAALGRGPEERDDDVVDRVAGFGSGAFYAVLCAVAVEVVTGRASSSSSSVPHHAAGVLGWPGGRWLVGGAGVVMVVVGLYQGYRAVTREFLEEAKVGEMDERTRRVVTVVGVVGHLARMVVFGLVGVFLVKAAADFDPRTAVGVGGALSRLLREPDGSALLGVVAAGLVVFGVYSVSDARYHRL
jgi:uncharacterized protein DUF1206